MSELRRKRILAMAAVLAGGLALLGGACLLVAAPAAPAAIAPVLMGFGIAALVAALYLIRQLERSASEPVTQFARLLERVVRAEPDQSSDDDASLDSERLTAAVAALRRTLLQSNASRNHLDRVLASMNEAIFFVDPKGLIQRANAAAGALLAQSPETLVGTELATLIIADSPAGRGGHERSQPAEAVFRRHDGNPVSVSYTKSNILGEDGELEWIVYAVQNVDDRKRVEQRIRYLARTDSLTKIANRMQFQHLLQQAIARAKRGRHYIALLYLDVDRFKDINDTFGHAAGDTSLEMFSRRICEVLPPGSVPGRLAGDEFCVLLRQADDMDTLVAEVKDIAGKLLGAVSRPFQVQGQEIFMSTSVGIALYPRDGDNVVDLLRNSDAALYQAKKAGGNCFEFFDRSMNTPAEERLTLKSKLRRAFERDELRLHYQPKYRLSNGRIAGAEALVRWDLPERGLVFPADFIPLAEETNLILQIGDWVLDRVCADYKSWQRVVPSPCRVSVNLSLRQLQQQRFLEGVREIFKRHAISPTCLELEITETTLMEDTKSTIRILDALYGMGLHLAIDDFGTGYSSLSALQQFPISTLKIDQSFVRDLVIDRDNAAIVKTIIQMAHSMQLEVVAEGIESQEQLEFLRTHGCDLVQGHLFGDPMAADEFLELLVADAEGSGRYQALFA